MNDDKFAKIVNSITAIVCVIGCIAIIVSAFYFGSTKNKAYEVELQSQQQKFELQKINEQRKTDSLYMNLGYVRIPNIDPKNYHWELKTK